MATEPLFATPATAGPREFHVERTNWWGDAVAEELSVGGASGRRTGRQSRTPTGPRRAAGPASSIDNAGSMSGASGVVEEAPAARERQG
jgi:hypothetical protein